MIAIVFPVKNSVPVLNGCRMHHVPLYYMQKMVEKKQNMVFIPFRNPVW
jgi:hypothetical protein